MVLESFKQPENCSSVSCVMFLANLLKNVNKFNETALKLNGVNCKDNCNEKVHLLKGLDYYNLNYELDEDGSITSLRHFPCVVYYKDKFTVLLGKVSNHLVMLDSAKGKIDVVQIDVFNSNWKERWKIEFYYP